MNAVLLLWIGIFFSTLGSLLIFSVGKPIDKLAGLFLLYLGGSIMLLSSCSVQTCLALLVCGIGSTVLLGTGNLSLQAGSPFGKLNESNIFRFFLELVLALLSFTLTERLRFWIPVRRTILFVAAWICMQSIVSLSLDDRLSDRCIYLQSICLAFTIVYIYMESSILVFGCFAAINLLMAFGGSVLSMGQTETAEGSTEVRP